MGKREKKYESIVNSIIKRIKTGDLKPGERLPGQFALADEYSVSSITANRALNELKEQGFIERRQRSGSFVCVNPRFIKRMIILTNQDYGKPDAWLRFYWDEICRINEENGTSTRIMSNNDPDVENSLFDQPLSTGVIMAGYEDPELITMLESQNIPCLVLGIRAKYGRFNVTENRMDAGRALCDKIYHSGAKKVVFIGNFVFSNHSEGLEGCRMFSAQQKDFELVEFDTVNMEPIDIIKKLEKLNELPDAFIVMGGALPFQIYPFLKAMNTDLKFGFFTENQIVMDFRGMAYLASYSQEQIGRLATDMLEDISSGRIKAATTKFTDTKIFCP